MKNLLFILFVLTCGSVHAQTTFCLAPSCPQTVKTTDTAKIFAQLTTSDGIKGITFSTVSGPTTPALTVLSPLWVTSLQQIQTVTMTGLSAGTYVFKVTGTSTTGTVGTVLDSLTVIPATVCPPARTVTGFTLTLVNGVWTAKYTFSDGSLQ